MESVSVTLRTLTPLWTGDVDRKCSKIKETGIIGSLRWWFEAIVRGLGGNACDSIGEVVKKCELKFEEYKKGVKPEKIICSVCYVFGTTGWSRRFRLEIIENGVQEIDKGIIIKTRSNREHKGWFLGSEDSGGVLGSFKVNIHNGYKDIICLLLNVSSLWGIGAKTQDGFGICEFRGDYNIKNAIHQIKYLKNGIKNGNNLSEYNNNLLPNLEDFFFVKIIIKEDIKDKIENIFSGNLYKKVKECGKSKERQININDFQKSIPEDYRGQFYPTAPLIRHWLRGLFRNGNDDLRHFLFGFIAKNVHKFCGGEVSKQKCKKCKKRVGRNEIEKKPILDFGNKTYEKMGSKIFVSHLYKLSSDKWEFKIWGYIPKVLPNNENRDTILQKLFKEIKKNMNFTSILDLNKNSVEIKWYEISQKRSSISSVEELIREIIEVNKND